MSATATSIAPPASDAAARRRHWDALVRRFIYATALAAIALIVLIFVFVGREALPIFFDAEVQQEANLGKLFLPQQYGTPEAPLPYVWQPVSTQPKYSLMPLMMGTLKVTLVSMLVATPFGVFAAIFSSEFAPRWLREAMKPVIELLAGIPSVVLGFFALIVLATWLQDQFGLIFRLNVMNAGIALGLAVVPIIYTISEDALTAVPRSYRNASAALGASRWQTAWNVVLPAALPGVFAGIVLGFGRAVGETMIVLMASGNAAITSWDFTEPVRTLSASVAAELAEVVFGDTHYHVLFFIGMVLFLISLGVNIAASSVVFRAKKRAERILS